MRLWQLCTGPNGSAVTSANATSGQQFDTPGSSGGGSFTFTNARSIHGSACCINVHMPAASATAYGPWKASITSPTNNAYMYSYWYFTAVPTVNMRLMSAHTPAGGAVAALTYATGGKIRTQDSAGTAIVSSTSNVPLNTWVRVEFEVTGISGTTGTVNGRFYSGANLEGTTPDSGGTAAGPVGTSNVGGQVQEVRLGTGTASTMTAVWDGWAADFMYADTVMPAPIGTQGRLSRQAADLLLRPVPAVQLTRQAADVLLRPTPGIRLTRHAVDVLFSNTAPAGAPGYWGRQLP